MSNWNYPEDLLESAMGIISNATDWDLVGREEWVKAAREWLDAYQLSLESARGKAPTHPKGEHKLKTSGGK